MPVTNLGDPDARRMVLGLGITMVFFPSMEMAFGVLLRSTAGGITGVLGLPWLPQIFGTFLPMWWREHVFSLLPSDGRQHDDRPHRTITGIFGPGSRSCHRQRLVRRRRRRRVLGVHQARRIARTAQNEKPGLVAGLCASRDRRLSLMTPQLV